MSLGGAPSSSSSRAPSKILLSTRAKRDSFIAELERDPQHSTAKRQQRSQAFTSHMARASLERQLISAQAAKVELENKLRQKDVYIEQLEGDRRFLTTREQAEREEKEKEREANTEYKKNAETDLKSLRDIVSTFRNENIELSETYSALQRAHTQLLAAQKVESSTLQRKNAELEQKLVDYQAISEEQVATIKVMQQKLDQFVTPSDVKERRYNEDENWGVIRDELHRQSSYLRSLETTNAKLSAELGRHKDRQGNLEVLREEKRALERKVLVVNELRDKVASLEARVEVARQERQEWEDKSRDVGPPSKSSLSVVQSLSELRLTHAQLLEEHGVTVAALRTREAEFARLSEPHSEAQEKIGILQAEIESLKNKVTRGDHNGEVEQAIKALEEARTKAKAYEQKVEELEQTLFELRGKIGAGNHVPPGIRVLCLRDNPAQQWADLRQSVMDRLKSENEALMMRLRALENSGVVDRQAGTSREDELVPRECWEVLHKEKEELEGVVKQKEKRLLRLQQVFTAKSAEFREAIASILGFKLAFYPNGQVKVTSIYDLSASFVFQPLSKSDKDGARMQLVAQGEGGPQDLPQLMHYWVEDEQCIPGFLASITLECYDKSKRGGGVDFGGVL